METNTSNNEFFSENNVLRRCWQHRSFKVIFGSILIIIIVAFTIGLIVVFVPRGPNKQDSTTITTTITTTTITTTPQSGQS
jgi:hypothetical protein